MAGIALPLGWAFSSMRASRKRVRDSLGRGAEPREFERPDVTPDGFRVEVRLEDERMNAMAIGLGDSVPASIALRREGVRATSGDIVLGDPGFDDRFVVTGPLDDVVLAFDGRARRALVEAAEVGWTLDDGRLVCGQLADDLLANACK